MNSIDEKNKILSKLLASRKPEVDQLFVIEAIEKSKRIETPPPTQPSVSPVTPPKPSLIKEETSPETFAKAISSRINANTTSNANTTISVSEFDILKKTVQSISQKLLFNGMGGGGTGVVRIWDTDDFDRNSAGEGKFMKFTNGWFVLDEINPYEVVHNTTLVTGNTYVVQDSDYYIGANNQTEAVTIILPSAPSSGRLVIIKDESGRAQINPIKIDGNIDNDPGGAEIRINNGGVQLIYRNGWRIV